MSGGGKTQTSTSTVQIPQEVLARYNAVNTRAEGVAETPFQAYSYDPSAFVAPMTETQNQAIGQIGQASGMAQPYFQTGAAATLGGMGPANLGELDTSKYMSPYLRNVVQNTADILGQQNRQDMSGALGTAIQSGAGFGDRSGIAAANLNRQQMMGMGSTIGNLLNQGYQQAQGVAQQQQSADLAARQANLARLLQGGQSIGQLGAGAQGAALAGSQALLGAGTQQQQTEQAGKSALYNQYQQERAYPFQVAQFLGNIAMGTGALSGNTTTETRPAGFFSGLKRGGRVDGASYRRGGLVPESMGGHVNAGHMGEGYADGGAPQMDYATMVMQQLFGGMNPGAGVYGQGAGGIGAGGFVPQANLPVGQLNPAKISESAPQTSISDLVDTGEKLYEGAKEVKGWFGEEEPPVIDKNDPKFINWDRAASGGAIRPGLAAGGMPYDPQNTGYVPDNTPKANPELTPAKISGGQESGLDKIADIAKIVGTFMPMRHGGVAGRHGYAGGGYPEDAESLMAFARRKARDTAESPDNPVQQNSSPQVELSTALANEAARRRALLEAGKSSYDPGQQNLPPETVTAPTAAAVGQPAGLSAADTALPPFGGVSPAATGAALPPPSYKNTLLGGVSPAAAQIDLTASKAPSPYGFEGYAGEGLGRNGINPIVPRNETEFERLTTAAASLFQSHLGPLKDALSQRGVVWKDNYDPIRDFFSTRPNEAEAVKAKRAYGQEIVDFYKDLGPYFEANPAEYERALAEPVKYFEDRAGLIATNPKADLAPGAAPGLVPSSGSLLGEAKFDMFGAPPAAKSPYAPGVFMPGMVPPIPRARADRPAALARAALPATAEEVAAAALKPGVPFDLATGKPATGALEITPAADAKSIYKATALNDEGTRVDASGDDPQGDSLAGFHASQFGKPLDQVKAQDISAAQDKWWNEQGGDQIAERYGANFAAAYVNLSMLNPNFARQALKDAGGDPDLFFDKFKSRLMRLDKWEKYGKGWSNRIDRADALASGATPPVSGGGGGGSGTLGDASIPSRDVPDTRPDGGRDDQPAPGLGGKNLWEQMVEKAGSEENIILPFLSGLGKMAGSQSRFLGTAVLEGIGGGAEAYMNRQKQLADIAGTKATAFSNISTALSNMLVKDATGNVFVPLQNGNYQLLWDYMDNPEGQSILGQQADRLLRELNAGGPSGAEQLQEIIKTIPSGVEGGKVPPETPVSEEVSNIVWSPNSDRAILDDKEMARSQGRGAYLEQSMNDYNTVRALAGNAVSNAQDMNVTINTVADALANPPAAQPGPAGAWRSWVDSNIKFLANIVGVDVSSLGDMSNQSAVLNKLATMSAGRMLPEGQNALQALQQYISSNPNMEMPPEAMKTITVSLMQANQQALERNAYYRNYMKRSGGFNMGADQSFYSEIGRLHQQEHDQLMTIFNDADLVKALTSGISFDEAQALIDQALGPENASRVLARFFAPGAY